MHADAIPLRDTREDLLAPVLMALALHVAIVAVLLLAGWWQPAPRLVSVAGPAIEASLVVSSADIAAAERAAEEAPKPAPPAPEEAAPPPQPVPAPQPQQAPEEVQPVPQEQPPVPDTVDQEAVARLALQREQAREREEQEARRRQEQIDLTERERQAEVERRQRQREQVEEIRRQREEAARRTRMEEQRLQQLADRQAAPTPAPQAATAAVQAAGTNGVDTDLRAQYVLALTRAIENNWLRPDTVQIGQICRIRIIQLRGGEVISVSVLPGCAYDALGQRSVEAAVLRAQPLPYAGFESVFERDIQLNFRATED